MIRSHLLEVLKVHDVAYTCVNPWELRRLSTGISGLIVEANTTICSQRNLDATFKNTSSHNEPNSTFWGYFASVEGVHRAYPGRVCPPISVLEINLLYCQQRS